MSSQLDAKLRFDHFRYWVGRQPAELEYDYCDPAVCPVAKYLEDHGFTETCGGPNWAGGVRQDGIYVRLRVHEVIENALMSCWTYGELAEQLSEQLFPHIAEFIRRPEDTG